MLAKGSGAVPNPKPWDGCLKSVAVGLLKPNDDMMSLHALHNTRRVTEVEPMNDKVRKEASSLNRFSHSQQLQPSKVIFTEWKNKEIVDIKRIWRDELGAEISSVMND